MLVIIINGDPADYIEPHQGWAGKLFFTRRDGTGRGGEGQGQKSTGRGGTGKGSKSAGRGGPGAGNILCISAD